MLILVKWLIACHEHVGIVSSQGRRVSLCSDTALGPLLLTLAVLSRFHLILLNIRWKYALLLSFLIISPPVRLISCQTRVLWMIHPLWLLLLLIVQIQICVGVVKQGSTLTIVILDKVRLAVERDWVHNVVVIREAALAWSRSTLFSWLGVAKWLDGCVALCQQCALKHVRLRVVAKWVLLEGGQSGLVLMVGIILQTCVVEGHRDETTILCVVSYHGIPRSLIRLNLRIIRLLGRRLVILLACAALRATTFRDRSSVVVENSTAFVVSADWDVRQRHLLLELLGLLHEFLFFDKLCKIVVVGQLTHQVYLLQSVWFVRHALFWIIPSRCIKHMHNLDGAGCRIIFGCQRVCL